ncbi:tRNA pseudouridine synthase-like 1 [Oratosquilla oratoria]|uniref:tRNA pseudouridine synthase-like 1 n=1 Tax=Oratosquilla oratoria TaxID=337810 RepID=UPI003F75AEF8
MKRYLFYFGYIGTQFRGLQKQTIPNNFRGGDFHTVQGHFEKALTKFAAGPLSCSSRTDAGVHALRTTAHVDLKPGRNGEYPSPNYVTKVLNCCFYKEKLGIRVQETRIVPDTFHSRYDAIERTYLYRLIVVKPEALEACEPVSPLFLDHFIPVPEIDRAYIIKPPFDARIAHEVCGLFEGEHDFATFQAALSKSSYPRETKRNIDKFCITPGKPLFDPSYYQAYERLNFWDITVTAKSFLYKQVRRMVAVLVAAAKGHITLSDVKHMLEVPGHKSWNDRALTAPAGGLYLVNVKYNPDSLLFSDSEGKEQVTLKENKALSSMEILK